MSIPPPSLENPQHGISSLCDLAHHTRNSHPTPAHDVQDNISDTLTKLSPLGRGTTGAGSSSPSITSSDGSLEDFFRLPDLQNNIPIDPAILANNAPWDISDLHQPVQQGDDLANPKATYPYPVPCSYSTNNNFLSNEQSRRRKRGPQQPEPPAKQLHVASASSMKDSSTALHSHFLLLQLNKHLQFLSWLFEGALASCMPDSAPPKWGDKSAWPVSHSAPHKIEKTHDIMINHKVASPSHSLTALGRQGSLDWQCPYLSPPQGQPTARHRYITGEAEPPAHRTAMRSRLLLYAATAE
ncbi:hypothetical protein CIRG_02567 [Coccidioides immitis RMSCC 2394]|uniref:Uncharacterized protein n=1 Tax=Coccidioides immitis RMSCC 2394 TaxID=404692 RepID=A0A0J6Y552_COCIT|nr:hypothetical protein CIRG_02567 [Coccidioides immitis RMSCC 2394]